MQIRSLVITGLLLPIGVGVILLLVEHNIIAPRPVDVAQGISKPQVKSGEGFSTAPGEPPPTKPVPHGSVPKEIADMKTILDVADKIYGSDPRNAEYRRIVDLAIARYDLEFATTVADKIYGSDPRNLAYELIVQAALAQERFDFAGKVADKIYGSDKRNALYKKIIEAQMLSKKVESAAPSGLPSSK